MLTFGEFAVSVEFIRVGVLHFAYVFKTFLQLRAGRLLPALESNERTRAAGPGAPVIRAVKLEALALDHDLLEHGVFPPECRSYSFPSGWTFSQIALASAATRTIPAASSIAAATSRGICQIFWPSAVATP